MANAKKPPRTPLKAILPSPWLKKIVSGIEYWVHTPSRKGGIHIRGLAELCGVHISTLQNAIKQGRKLTEIRETDLSNILKDK